MYAMPRKIAVIDDDAPFIRFIERALGVLGYECCPITTFDIDEAVRVIAEARCDAAIVDVFMYNNPSGLACVDAIRAHPATAALPIIVASGAQDKLAKADSFLRGHRCAVLAKPFGIDDLDGALTGLLERVVVLTPASAELFEPGMVATQSVTATV
jgi:CheY-like chemotaxis protein